MTRQTTSRSASRAGKRRTEAFEPELEAEDDEDFQSDADYFLDELRMAVDRAHCSGYGGVDLYDNPRGGGFDRLQLDPSD